MDIAFPGDRNQGLQVGSNSGNIYYGPPERPPVKPKPCSTVPFRRDPDFIVDRDILTKIHEICSKPASRAALVGLGGVGKSQLAIEYSYQIQEKSPHMWIFWVHASNASRFEEGYRTIAEKVGLPHRDDPTADILKLVSNWLSDEANGRWTLILDNADDATVFLDLRKGGEKSDVGAAVSLSTFLPQAPNGSILVTTRSKDAAFDLTGRYRDIIKIEPMHEDRALLLFEKKLPRGFDKNGAKELLRVLDYMPLAISQAAAYISQRAPRTTVASYLDTFCKSDRNQTSLLNSDTRDLRRDDSVSNSIITTWQISFEYIRDKRPSAARLLSLMSFFDRQGIPMLLLHYDDRSDRSDIGFKHNSDVDLEEHRDMTFEFEEDVSTLTNYSLIKSNVNNGQFEMHRLVQLSTRIWLELNCELEKWKKMYIEIIWKAFPRAQYENWSICKALFPHAEVLLAYRPSERKHLICWSEVLNNAGYYACIQGNYSTAEDMNRRALEERIKTLGETNPNTLTSVNDLASVLRHQGKYEAAEMMGRQALDGREKALGKEHPDTLTSVFNLARVLRDQGKYEAAEKLNQRVLDGREKALGKEHPDTLMSVSNLASVLSDQGKYEAAARMNRRALDGREKALGKDHPHTLISVSNLAAVLSDQGKYEVAERMYQRALDGHEKALGKEHPHTLESVSNLASVLRVQGKYEVTESMNQRVLEGREKALGKEHPHTLGSVNNLANVLREQGKYEAAERMHRRALDGREKALGKEHPDTLASVNNLANMLQEQGKYEAAERMHRRALDGREKALGKEHPDTLRSVNNLALVLSKRGKYETAERMYQRALDGYEKALGKEHPDTLASVNNLANVLREQGKYEAAERMHRRALDGREKALGKEHPDTLASVHWLAYLLQKQKKYQEAKPLYERACAGDRKVLGTDHPKTVACTNNYASMMNEMNQRSTESAAEHQSPSPSPQRPVVSAKARGF